jgi:hypothetical protein
VVSSIQHTARQDVRHDPQAVSHTASEMYQNTSAFTGS